MKRFVRIMLLAILLPIDYMHAASIIKCCLSTEEKDAERPAESENTADKRNENTPRDIRIDMRRNKIVKFVKYLDPKDPSTTWTLARSEKTDPHINVRYNGIKNSKDTRPITWQDWDIEGTKGGITTLIQRKFVNNQQGEESIIKVTVVE